MWYHRWTLGVIEGYASPQLKLDTPYAKKSSENNVNFDLLGPSSEDFYSYLAYQSYFLLGFWRNFFFFFVGYKMFSLLPLIPPFSLNKSSKVHQCETVNLCTFSFKVCLWYNIVDIWQNFAWHYIYIVEKNLQAFNINSNK